ncbi:hypothetical protein COJ21_00150 [Priestia megaterium]|nr:hypothetical protein COJ21_00150 [Priestia megaterium]
MVINGWVNPHPLTILKGRNKLRCKKWNYMFHFLVIKSKHLPCIRKRMTNNNVVLFLVLKLIFNELYF